MNTGRRLALVVVGLSLGISTGCSRVLYNPAQSVDEDAIADTVLRLENEMNESVDALDCETGLVTAGDREPIFVGGGVVIRGTSELLDVCREMVSGRTGATFDIQNREINVLSPDVAYVVRQGDYTIHRTDGTSSTAYLVMTTIWNRESEGWKMVHLHESVRLPAPDSTGSGADTDL